MNALDTLVTVRAEALVEHYHKTRDQVGQEWRERNRRYSLLVAMLAVAALLSLMHGPLVEALVRQMVGQLSPTGQPLALPDSRSNSDLQTFLLSIAATLLVHHGALVHNLLMIAFLVMAFYLMTDLFHRSAILSSGYVYLALMEREIRRELRLGDTMAFTREGPFYQSTGARMSRLVGWANKGMLGCLLTAFFAARLYSDFPQEWPPLRLIELQSLAAWPQWAGRNLLFLLDVITAALTSRMFLGYVVLKPPSEEVVRADIARAEQ